MFCAHFKCLGNYPSMGFILDVIDFKQTDITVKSDPVEVAILFMGQLPLITSCCVVKHGRSKSQTKNYYFIKIYDSETLFDEFLTRMNIEVDGILCCICFSLSSNPVLNQKHSLCRV